jgi:hypothetical protein
VKMLINKSSAEPGHYSGSALVSRMKIESASVPKVVRTMQRTRRTWKVPVAGQLLKLGKIQELS